MKYPTYKEFSHQMDEMRTEDNKPKASFIKKIFYYIFTLVMISFLYAFLEKCKEKKEFNKKYKTVVKENMFGFKSYEYHEKE